jgi:hypothetical protein
LYGCETWSHVLREEDRPKVFENIFEPKRDEVAGWIKQLNEELHKLFSLPNIIRTPSQEK